MCRVFFYLRIKNCRNLIRILKFCDVDKKNGANRRYFFEIDNSFSKELAMSLGLQQLQSS